MAITFAGVESELASQLRLDLNKSEHKTLIDRWINLVLEDIHGRHDWWWTLDRQVIQTVIDKTAGTVAVSAGGTTVTGTDTAFASADVGKFIQFDNNADWYKITAVASTTSLTIEKAFNGTADETASTYTIRKFHYSLPSAEKIISAKQYQTPRPLDIYNMRGFDKKWYTDSTGGARDMFIWGQDSDGNIQFLVYPWPDEARNLEIRYKKKCTEDSLTYFPEKWRHVVVNGAMVYGYRYIAAGSTTFNPILIDKQVVLYEGGINKMLADSEPESDSVAVMASCEELITPIGPQLPEDYA